MRCRFYPGGTGILTRFPFDRTLSGSVLGPTNPQLISIAGEPYPHSADGILTRLYSYYRGDSHFRRLHPRFPSGFYAIGTPAYRTGRHYLPGLGSRRPA